MGNQVVRVYLSGSPCSRCGCFENQDLVGVGWCCYCCGGVTTKRHSPCEEDDRRGLVGLEGTGTDGHGMLGASQRCKAGQIVHRHSQDYLNNRGAFRAVEVVYD